MVRRIGAAVIAAIIVFGVCLSPQQAAWADSILAASTKLGPTAASTPITLSLVLPLRNHAKLDALINKLYNPNDREYGHYLTPAEFSAQFGPTNDQVASVEAAASSLGLTVLDSTPNHTVIHVRGSASTVDAAFKVTMNTYTGPDGGQFVTADRAPTLPLGLAGALVSVVGLDGSLKMHHSGMASPPRPVAGSASPGTAPKPNTVEYYSGNGFIPSDVYSVYDWTSPATGTGMSVGLVEFAGWTSADIVDWESLVLTTSSLVPTLDPVDGGSQAIQDADGSMECTLDVDMILLMAPGISNLYMYEAPYDGNAPQEALDMYNQIATDDKVSVVSSSWGFNEDDFIPSDDGYADSVEQAFQQMAVQGQTFCVAAGDAGAYADQTISTPNVGFEAAMPYVLSVGGTDLTDGPGETYVSETSWADTADTGRGPIGTGGGGGISSYWTLPNFQIGAFNPTVNPQGSLSNRNIPDVSLFGDYDDNGYEIIWTDATGTYGPAGEQYYLDVNGTSAASPLWAGLLADVNAGRSAVSEPGIGFADPAIYSLAEVPSTYASDFHDINDGSNNLFYNAVTGYDNSTGWGSFVANSLYTDLVNFSAVTVTALSFNPSTVSAGQSTTGTVTLSGGAPSVGATVEIVDPTNTPVASAVVSSGGTSGTFTLTAPIMSTTYTAAYDASTASQTLNVTAPVGPPTVAQPASANPSPVTGTTTSLSVLGADPAGESTLTYTWACTGPAAVAYSANGTNAAKNTMATFIQAGSYTFTVTISDPYNQTVTSSVTVSVNQTTTTIGVTPPSVLLALDGTQQFSAAVVDQFGNPMPSQPSFTWSLGSGSPGTLSSTGLYTATASGTATVIASAGALSGEATAVCSPPQLQAAWTYSWELQTPTAGLGAATGLNGNIYAVAGYNGPFDSSTTSSYLSEVQTYNPSTNTVSLGQPIPTARVLAATLGPDGLIYTMGGYDGEGVILNNVEYYDPATNTSGTLSVLPTPSSGLAAATGPDGHIYAMGGFNYDDGELGTVEAYDIPSGTWTTVAPMPTERDSMAAVTGANGLIYVIGGENGSGVLNTVEAYNTSTNTWTEMATMPTARALLAAVSGPDGRIYAIGGYDGSEGLTTVEVYDPLTNSWSTGPSLLTPTFYLAATVGQNGVIYAIGGETSYSSDPLQTVEAYVSIPPAVTSLIATPGNAQVSLAWTTDTFATSYNVYRATTSGAEGTTPIGTTTGTGYQDTGLTNGVEYFYKLAAVGAAGTSPQSSEVSATPEPSGPTAPPTPTGVAATARNTQVSLLWSASTGATSYSIYRATTSGAEGSTPVGTAAGTSFTDTGLTNGVKYFYKVAGVNAVGTSAQSSEVSATPEPPAPAAPTGLTATAGNAQVSLSWSTSTGATSYNIYRATTSGAEGSTPVGTSTSGSYTSTGLTNGDKYYFTVAAVNGAGTSAQSNEASTTLTPNAPTGLTASAGNTQVGLSWTSSYAATSYSIYRGTTSGGEGSTPVGTANGLSYTNSGLTNGVTYFYKVASVNAGGTGMLSAEASATPEPPIPSAPSSLTATAGNAQVALAWTGSTGATSYDVYRGTATGAEGSTAIGTTTSTSYTDTGVTNFVTYYYKVAAANGGGVSAMSNEASATPTPPLSPNHVLWSNANGSLSLWTYNPATGKYTQNSYGPFANWSATAIADGPDGMTRVLWVSTGGGLSIWNVNSSTGAYTQFSFGPFPGWTPSGVTVSPSNVTHVLWSSSGSASIWNYNTGTGAYTQETFGTYAGWSAKTIADGPDGLTRVLWVNSSGTTSIWSLSMATGAFTQHSFGPYPSWSAVALSVNAANTTHVLWTNVSKVAALWNYNTSTGSFTQNDYGVFPGWTATSIADGPDGNTQFIWDSTTGTCSIWDLNNTTGAFTQNLFGPFPAWTATAISAYP
ncbi:MAG: kelch repeat-containing protein [Capsulimonadaceae bacterium]